VSADTEGWEVASEEQPTMMVFDTLGDQFTGIYLGRKHIVPDDSEKDEFDQDLFQDPSTGELFAVNSGYNLRRALEEIEPGKTCRLTYVKNVDTGQPSPMKSFRVETRK
jgi:hypothetical protein